jgi:hypothetical protein
VDSIELPQVEMCMLDYFMQLIKKKYVKMKNNIQKIISKSLLLLFLVLTYSCSDIIERNNEFPILNPTNSDSEAGNWKPYLLTSEMNSQLPFLLQR